MLRKSTLFFLLVYGSMGLLTAQQGFFLDNWQPKTITLPPFNEIAKTDKPATVSILIHNRDTLTRIPVYVFGDNANQFTGCMSDNKTLMKYMAERKMGYLRGPSGSISDVFFWNRYSNNPPSDVPSTLLSGGSTTNWEWYGRRFSYENWSMDVDSFYHILSQTGSKGMLTVNYGYARYGTSANPVAQAAHMAAEWVRYDKGRTRFWEIGNEVSGSWEAGYRINTSLNQDGQPEYINGTLYGQHCRVFIDSMRTAAAEVGSEIYIGAVTAQDAGSDGGSWNNKMMKEVGNEIDFYIIHSYFTPYQQDSRADTILNCSLQTKKYVDYVNASALGAGMPTRPIALTEYNTFASGSNQNVSQIGGMFATLVVSEVIKSGIGGASRWDLANGWANGDDHGMFSAGDEPGVSKYAPRPAFYYLYYLQKYLGDIMLKSDRSGSSEISAYASHFSSGQIGAVLANRGLKAQTMRINIEHGGTGNKYYTYTFLGGTDDIPTDPGKPFSRKVYINGEGPSSVAGGPSTYASIKANAYSTDGEILIDLPPFSTVFALIDTGDIILPVNQKVNPFINWNIPSDISYGTALSKTQLNATVSAPGSIVYNPPLGTILNAGNGISLEMTFIPNDTMQYDITQKTVTINVKKITPVINFTSPIPVVYPTPLGDIQLNASCSIPGTFSYNPPAGTIFDAGYGNLITATFLPADTINYQTVSKTVHINVSKATPLITWETPDDIAAGTALTSMQLNATADQPGIFYYKPPVGTVLDSGANQMLMTVFHPTDSLNFNQVTWTVAINVTGSNDVAKLDGDRFTAFPNPVSDQLSLSGLDAFRQGNFLWIEICSVDGRILRKMKMAHWGNTENISMEDLPKGILILRLYSDMTNQIMRILKN